MKSPSSALRAKAKRPSKSAHVLEQLTAMAERLGPNAIMPTFREMCRDFGVAKVTLSTALRELELQRVIVRHHGKGIYVSDRANRKTIGLVFNSNIFSPVHSPYWTLLLEAAQRETNQQHCQLYTYFDIPSGETNQLAHQQLLDDLAGERLNGVVVVGGNEYRQVEAYARGQVPIVLVGHNPHAPYRVVGDMEWDLNTAVTALMQQGCRSIALLAFVSSNEGPLFLAALEKAGLPATPEILWWERFITQLPGPTREDFGRHVVQYLLATGQKLPDGLVTIDDTVTRGVCTALKEAGLSPGRDLRICATCNKGSPVLQAYETELTLLENDPGDFMRAGITILTTLMDHRVPNPPITILRPTLRLPHPALPA